MNPLQDGLRIEPTPGPTTIVIFGASGDLTRRKLLPALHHLSRGQRLPARFTIIGVARTQQDDEAFREQFYASLREFGGGEVRDEVTASITGRMHYLAGDLDDPALYQRLAQRIGETGADEGVLYYLAIPPSAYASVIAQLGRCGLASPPERGWRRVIVEKPFGTDLSSARELNHAIHEHFDESQVFRIDHYLGKETVQNLLVFRFANGMFEPIWNRRYIDHVQITAAETVGVERRAAYYEEAGALRHGPEPSDAAAHARRHGAADGVQRGKRTRPQDGCAAVDAAAHGHGRRGFGRLPRAVRGGLGRRPHRSGVSRGTRRQRGV
ncbi:MAG TPA: glucose-6-phosphate dehydrogenase, partial [Vicinamibacterales bacterium]|nr:glucose-6-phosphate dehydrogenase [Vicinamibacterales bacterium]